MFQIDDFCRRLSIRCSFHLLVELFLLHMYNSLNIVGFGMRFRVKPGMTEGRFGRRFRVKPGMTGRVRLGLTGFPEGPADGDDQDGQPDEKEKGCDDDHQDGLPIHNTLVLFA